MFALFFVGVGGLLGIWFSAFLYRMAATKLVTQWTLMGERGFVPEYEDSEVTPHLHVRLLRSFEQMAKANAEIVKSLIDLNISPETFEDWLAKKRPNVYGRHATGNRSEPKFKAFSHVQRVRMGRAVKHLEESLLSTKTLYEELKKAQGV